MKTELNFLKKEITATEAALEKAKTALTEHADHAAGLQRANDELLSFIQIAETLYKNHQQLVMLLQEAPQQDEPIGAEIQQ